jgi:hypothetical protein
MTLEHFSHLHNNGLGDNSGAGEAITSQLIPCQDEDEELLNTSSTAILGDKK